jgi:rhamnosyl/mannosyltransferase
MRVLHFFKTSLPDTFGGIELVIDQIARGAAQHGVTTDVLSLSTNDPVRNMTFNGYRRHTARQDFQIASTGISTSVIPAFLKLAQQADLIHYHFPWPFMDLLHFAMRAHKPTLLTYHSDIIRQRHLLRFYRPLQARFLGAVDHIVATSPSYLATSDVLGRYRDKVSVIPIGLDQSSYPQPSERTLRHWKARFGGRFFLFVGVLRYYKGLHILLEAARRDDFPIVIVGAGPIERELRAQAARLGLRNTHFLGQLPDEDKVALLHLSYAVVFPSHLRSEAFGISLLEGAMFGKPMISSEIGTGTTFINIHQETGLVVPPDDPQGLRAAMQWLWDNPDQALAMGRKAAARYKHLFTAEQMVQRYVALYRRMAGNEQ